MADELINVEDAILESIGEGDEQSTNDTESSDSQETTSADEQTQQDDSGQSTEQESTGQSQEQQNRGGPQDLKDASGNIVAAGGKERRFYEQAQRFRVEAENGKKEIESLKGQLEAINSAGNLGTQYDLTPDELSTGAQLVKSFKEDPVNTVKYLLTQAQSNGHNIDGLTGSADMSAIKKMMEDTMGPLLQERQANLDTQARDDQAKQIHTEFMAKHPDADIHQDSLARLLDQDPSLTPEAAYFKLKSFYLERNLDWNSSLADLEAKAKDTPAPDPADANTQSSLPQGNVPAGNVTDTADIADVNTSMDDIIRQSMREEGMNPN